MSKNTTYIPELENIAKTMLTVTWAFSESESLITDHCNKYKNEKAWNVARIPKMWHRDTKRAKAAGNMAPIDALDAGLPQTFHLQKRSICEAWWKEASLYLTNSGPNKEYSSLKVLPGVWKQKKEVIGIFFPANSADIPSDWLHVYFCSSAYVQ